MYAYFWGLWTAFRRFWLGTVDMTDLGGYRGRHRPPSWARTGRTLIRGWARCARAKNPDVTWTGWLIVMHWIACARATRARNRQLIADTRAAVAWWREREADYARAYHRTMEAGAWA